MSQNRISRLEWRQILGSAIAVAAAAEDLNAVLNGPDALPCAILFRGHLRTKALSPFGVEGASFESARMAFVMLGKAVLDCGLPKPRQRLAASLDVLASQLEGVLVDDVTAESLRRAGVAD